MKSLGHYLLRVNRFGPMSRLGTRCWLWTGAVAPSGYGAMRTWPDGKNHRVHRWVYEKLLGPIPDGLQLDHLCRVKLCCRPTHLEPVTPLENTQRAQRDLGRWGPGKLNRTHCPQGHEYTDANTYLHPTGTKTCRTCTLEAKHRYRDRLRARGEKVR